MLTGYALVLTAAAIWATIGPVYRVLIEQHEMLPAQVAFWRAGIGGLLVLGWLLLLRRSTLKVAARDVPVFALFGVYSIALFYLSYIWAVDLVGVSLAVTLLYTSPAWVALGSWAFFRERPGPRQAAALLTALVGCLLVAQAYDPARLRMNALGLLAGLSAGATYAGYTLFGRLLLHRYSPWTTVVWPVITGAVLLGIAAAFLEPVDMPPSGAWGLLLYLALGPTVGAMALYLLSLRYVPGSVASVVATAEPVIAVLLSVTFLSE